MLGISKIYMCNVQMFMWKNTTVYYQIYSMPFSAKMLIWQDGRNAADMLHVHEGVIGITYRTVRFPVSLNFFTIK